MRDRLKELLMTQVECNKDGHGDCEMCDYKYADKECERHITEIIVDFLLENGVIAPPCKVGQTVYCIRYDKARKPFVKPLGVLSITTYGKGGFTVFTTKEDTWGKTAFATAEEAEKALEI